MIKCFSNILLRLIRRYPIKDKPLQPALYVNKDGFLKLHPDLSACLHEAPAVFAIESACVMQYYRGGIHLDIGCGSRKITANAVGVDIEEKLSNGSVNIVASADNLYVFADKSIDFISCIHSFEHYNNPQAVLKEWYRVLKIGGRIGIVVPARNGLIPDIEILGGHKFDYDIKTLKILISEFTDKFRILDLDTLKNGWSIDLVIEKIQ